MRPSPRSLLVIASIATLCAAVPTVAVSGSSSTTGEITAADYGRMTFKDSENVTNTWLSFKPGTQLVFTGATSEGKERIPHRLVYTITDLVKEIDGVRNVVIWDRDFSAGELVEAELSFFAQDTLGNVWHTGEYPEEYEDGKFVLAPAWIAGKKGAKAGIAMMANPRLGTPAYSQGFAPPPVNWTDHAVVYKKGVKTCVPAACYEDVLVTREFNPDEPGISQLKYYAKGVGNVRVGWMGKKDTGREVLLLTKIVKLSPAELDKARAEALKLEARAYKLKKAIYGHTPPATRIGGAS